MSSPSRCRSEAKATLLPVSSIRTVLRVSSVCEHDGIRQPCGLTSYDEQTTFDRTSSLV